MQFDVHAEVVGSRRHFQSKATVEVGEGFELSPRDGDLGFGQGVVLDAVLHHAPDDGHALLGWLGERRRIAFELGLGRFRFGRFRRGLLGGLGFGCLLVGFLLAGFALRIFSRGFGLGRWLLRWLGWRAARRLRCGCGGRWRVTLGSGYRAQREVTNKGRSEGYSETKLAHFCARRLLRQPVTWA